MIKLKDLIDIESIKEASGLGSSLGGKAKPVRKAGYKSSDTTSAKSDYDTKSTTSAEKDADFLTKRNTADNTAGRLAAFDDKKYTSTNKGGTTTNYSATNTGPRSLGFGPWQLNPQWTTRNMDNNLAQAAKTNAQTAMNTAKADKDTAKTAWDNSIEADRKQTIGITPPTTAGMKSGRGKGKGKGKKNKK